MNRNKTRNIAIHIKVISAENPIKNVEAGFTDVSIVVQVP
jgi:hypothetical protein